MDLAYIDLVSPKLIIALLLAAALLSYWLFNFVILYHLERFGVGVQPKKMAAIFFLGSIILFSLSVAFFSGLNFDSLKEQSQKLGVGIMNFSQK